MPTLRIKKCVIYNLTKHHGGATLWYTEEPQCINALQWQGLSWQSSRPDENAIKVTIHCKFHYDFPMSPLKCNCRLEYSWVCVCCYVYVRLSLSFQCITYAHTTVAWPWWLGSAAVGCWTRDQEVVGSTPTAALFGQQLWASCSHLMCLCSPSSITWYLVRAFMLKAPYCWQRHRVQWTRGYCRAVMRWFSNCKEPRYKSSALPFTFISVDSRVDLMKKMPSKWQFIASFIMIFLSPL